MDLGYTRISTNKRILMKNPTEMSLQYGKLHTLYETIIYLQKEIVKEQARLEELKKQEGQSNEV
jgi:hypothetical protein|tara:strand:+ start:297 stop:488 length:192 start_codon:yes stop_codon:yes gene_type:complete